jgi:hypothetical protein
LPFFFVSLFPCLFHTTYECSHPFILKLVLSDYRRITVNNRGMDIYES